MLLRKLIFRFSKITREQVLNSSYEELAALIARKYSNKQYKSANMVVLHEIQQHHKIISPGDWVLDIGAGPDLYWTQLALRLAENEKQTHRVISNDVIESLTGGPNQAYVKGNFLQEPVRTNIALKLGERKFDTILVDASPEFTGNLEEDGAQLNKIIMEALYFSNIFLQKGGNFVCKVLNCQSSRILQEMGRIFFHQFSIFRPSILRTHSPVQFFVMKGFSMNYQLEALKKFISHYRGSAKNKTELVREYQGKYSWDPIQIIRNKAKNDILGLRMEGRSERDIENMFSSDPFIKVGEILKQVRLIEKADADKDGVALKKAVNKFTDDKFYKDANEIPTTREEWINFLEKMENQVKDIRKRNKKKTEQKAPSHNLQPLRDNEVYMKYNNQVEDEHPPFVYIEADLHGKYETTHQKEYIQQELAKMQSLNPELSSRFQKFRKGTKKNAPLEDVFNPNIVTPDDQVKVEESLHDISEALHAISDQEFKKELDREGYENELQENVGTRVKGNRQKFKNR